MKETNRKLVQTQLKWGIKLYVQHAAELGSFNQAGLVLDTKDTRKVLWIFPYWQRITAEARPVSEVLRGGALPVSMQAGTVRR